MQPDDKIASWSLKNLPASTRQKDPGRMFPTEYLLRAFLSDSYFNTGMELTPDFRVLDIGCLYANNLVPFHERGMSVHGVEVNEEMVALAEQNALKWTMNLDCREGRHSLIPFPADFFDIVLSVNAIHYEDGQQGIDQSLAEMVRVGNSRCRCMIATAGAEHFFRENAVRKASNCYRIEVDDFRNGQEMAYFDSMDHLKQTCERFFSKVETAEITEAYPARRLQFWVAMCTI